MEIIPRPYQTQAVAVVVAKLRGPTKRALIVMATGLGKTITAALVTKELRPSRALFLVHNNFILDHAKREFADVLGPEVSMAVENGLTKSKKISAAAITFATWQTMSKILRRYPPQYFDLIIVDEAHHAEADTYRPVVDYFTGAKLGITATPDRDDELDIRNIFGPETVDISFEEAIAHGWLPRIEYHVVTDESLDEDALQEIVKEISEDKKRVTMAEVNRRVFIKKRDEEIAHIIDGYREKSIVFCANIDHAERMKSYLSLAAAFHSDVGDNQKDSWNKNLATIDQLNKGIIRQVCAVNAFNEGVNAPTVGLIAFCRVTGVVTVFRQQLGRGLRPGKDKLIVLDFVGNLERIQMLIEMMNKISDLHEKFTTRKERDSEGYNRRPFEVSGAAFQFTFSDKIVDLITILNSCERDFYPTWQEASKSALKLKIKSARMYYQKYREDSRLPARPQQAYSTFPGWLDFLANEKVRARSFYPSWQEASVAAIKAGITTRDSYPDLYVRDARLPSNPNRTYKDFPGWSVFLGKERAEKKFPYPTWQEASVASIQLGISDATSYREKYKGDPRLTSTPERTYKDFPGYTTFLKKGS